MNIKTKLIPRGSFEAVDASGRRYLIEEFTELVSVEGETGDSAWQPRNTGRLFICHGQALEAISDQEWEVPDQYGTRLYRQAPGG